ncbi:helix-turn-helix domain-containing protein [Kitasatospora sp. NPDC056531]|uniref:helix-turn-helix domain-containing protein n=1 Tax=Kitasatospora sp. NPDC056531 TaxID=3345856 RepID=UPI0036CD0A68
MDASAPNPARHRVVALLGAPQAPFELACAAEAFGTERAGLPSHYDLTLCTRTPGPVPTTLGVPLLVDAGLEALERADTVVVPGWQPPGSPVPARADESLAPLLEWTEGHLGERLAVEDLAARAGLSGRTLARRFAEQLGTSPGQWLLARRVDAARALLEQTDLPVEAVAVRVGLASAVNLRRRFRAALGTTPGAYRRTFGSARVD